MAPENCWSEYLEFTHRLTQQSTFFLNGSINWAELLFPGIGRFLVAVFLDTAIHSSNTKDDKNKLRVTGSSLWTNKLAAPIGTTAGPGSAGSDGTQRTPLISPFHLSTMSNNTVCTSTDSNIARYIYRNTQAYALLFLLKYTAIYFRIERFTAFMYCMKKQRCSVL